MTSSIFPDLNVWLALTVKNHQHHAVAETWRVQSCPSALVFCRQTQLGLFRLLSTPAIMGPRMFSQISCWKLYDHLIASGIAVFAEEPAGLESPLRHVTKGMESSAKVWADAYLCAFAEAADMTLVTFDQALHRRTSGSILLR